MLGKVLWKELISRFQEREFIQSYCQHWNGYIFLFLWMISSPIVIILYYKENESNLVTNFISTNSIQRTNVNIIPIIQESTVQINHLKNLGIQNVKTTHFLFAEFNLIPSSIIFHSFFNRISLFCIKSYSWLFMER